MSTFEVSEELARQVEAKTGESDLEQGIWRLLYQGRGRHVQDRADDGRRTQLSD